MPLHLRLCTILPVIIAAAPGVRAAEPAAIAQTPVERMIDLNRKAFADIRGQRFAAAKYWLAEALVIGETAGLEDDEMTARTYVHLAALALAESKDREEAVRQFALALKINPNITITAGLETPALKAAYLQAREQVGLPPHPDATTSPAALAVAPHESSPSPTEPATPVIPRLSQVTKLPNALDPDPPARVPTPLHCPLPFEIPRQEDFLVRCLTQKQQKRSSATFYYRPDASTEDYTALPMAHSPKGWLIAIIPGSDITGKSLSYYVKAQLPGSNVTLWNGSPEAPSAVLIKAPSPSGGRAADASTAAGRVDRDGRQGYHRAPGSVWFALGAGTGTAYHGRNPVDSNTRILNTNTRVYVEAGFSWAKLFQLEPEIGYQLSDRLSLSAMLRYQYAPTDGAAFSPTAGEHAVPTSAFAGFLRAQFIFASGGNFQTYFSGGAGMGNSFLAVIDERCGPTQCALDHSDTLHGGLLALTAGVGLLYHFAPNFGVFVDAKEIVSMPKVMALSEFNLGFAVAHNFGASAGALRASAADRVDAEE